MNNKKETLSDKEVILLMALLWGTGVLIGLEGIWEVGIVIEFILLCFYGLSKLGLGGKK